jgi:hypothetical protein
MQATTQGTCMPHAPKAACTGWLLDDRWTVWCWPPARPVTKGVLTNYCCKLQEAAPKQSTAAVMPEEQVGLASINQERPLLPPQFASLATNSAAQALPATEKAAAAAATAA